MAGPFFFAWVDPGEAFNASTHAREDEEVFSLSISQAEGEFASATVVLRNPRVGLLNAGRKRWAILAWDSGGTPGVIALFRGRLIGVPQDLQNELVSLEFQARPVDWAAQQAALGEALKVAPYWDPIWVEPGHLDDPDAILEARPQRWHIDRVTHEVTVSDIVEGEDGTIDVGGEFFYDSLSIGYAEVAVRRVMVAAEVGWTQAAAGTVKLTQALLKEAKRANSGDGNNISTYTGDGLARAWPVKGTAIGAGWSVGRSFVKRGDGKWVPKQVNRTVYANGLIQDWPLWAFRPHFDVTYDAERTRTEKLSFTLTADVQALQTDPGDEEAIIISTSSAQLNEPLDPEDSTDGLAAPIGDERRRSYLQTDRGHRSIQWLICLARARLLARSRAVDVKVAIPWEIGLALSCRRSMRVADDRIPGGAAVGKVIGYTLAADGDSGTLSCDVQIACCIGRSNTVSANPGTPTYVADGYVADGYQVRTGLTLSTAAGDVVWTPPDGQATPDDGIDFLAMTDKVVRAIQFIDGSKEQAAILNAFLPDPQAAIDALGEAFTQIRVDLPPLNGGPYETDYRLVVSDLMVPRGIDLEAAAA